MTEDNYPHLTDDEVSEKFNIHRRLSITNKFLALGALGGAIVDMLDQQIDSITEILGIMVLAIISNYLIHYLADNALERRAKLRREKGD